MPDHIVQDPPDTTDQDACRRASVARAWHLGHRIADTIQQHDLAPVTVHTHTGPTGRVWLTAEMTIVALATLAHATRARIRALGPGQSRAQLWLEDDRDAAGVVEYVHTAVAGDAR